MYAHVTIINHLLTYLLTYSFSNSGYIITCYRHYTNVHVMVYFLFIQ